MKIQNRKQEFIAFTDGICNVYKKNGTDKDYKLKKLGFTNRTVGYGRYYTAKATNVKVDRVIRIPFIPLTVNNTYCIEIAEDEYKIELVQEIDETNPRCLQLTLRKLSI